MVMKFFSCAKKNLQNELGYIIGVSILAIFVILNAISFGWRVDFWFSMTGMMRTYIMGGILKLLIVFFGSFYHICFMNHVEKCKRFGKFYTIVCSSISRITSLTIISMSCFDIERYIVLQYVFFTLITCSSLMYFMMDIVYTAIHYQELRKNKKFVSLNIIKFLLMLTSSFSLIWYLHEFGQNMQIALFSNVVCFIAYIQKHYFNPEEESQTGFESNFDVNEESEPLLEKQ